MDTKYKEDLFRKYVQFHESKLEASDNKHRAISDEYLRAAASALLSLPKIDPFHRFRMIRFYEVCENSLKALRTSNLRSLHNAAAMLETIGINLFLYPWKKEYKNIKTYTGPFVYYVRAALIDDDIRHILNNMGYVQELGTVYRLKDHVDTTQVKRVSFELFLACVECELLLEIYLQVRDKGYLEIDVVNERRNSNEDVRGCTDEMKRRIESKETLNTSMARMVLQKSASERASSKDYFKQKVTKPSKSVDTYDNYWDSKNKPPLMASLRKEPILVNAEDDIKDEIIRPSPSLLTMSSSPHGCSDEFLNISANPNGVLRTTTSYGYFPSEDDVDLYTDQDSRMLNFKRQEFAKHDVWLVKNEVNPNFHKRSHLAKETAYMKCQSCVSSGGLECQKCDMSLFRSDCPALKQSNVLIKSAVQNDNFSSSSVLREKSAYGTSQDRASQPNPKSKPSNALRCGFCNRPGASNTCTVCSKVSCDACINAYCHEYCCRKSDYHKFAPNNQLNYKSSQLSHLVYR
ncbi:spermatogenesis-associated protein 2 [Bombina bombina]|uniref:spermatogenesis-associated protein 2 n=1 Tax=Bombina bombina TaxID=8345 RepID=UPI00235AEF2D|nr:spermatogenesis-associated protein 2 [Bombina bombina]XP_053548031.1 spermatogenesis-associated protein 2 [Bombina bombina]